MTRRRTSLVLAALGLGLLGSTTFVQQIAAQNAPRPSSPAQTTADGLETPKSAPAANYLGPAMKSENYTVGPTARSDGLMRIFRVNSRYGKYDFDGVDFTILRLREIEATAALEKMSKSEAWAKSFGNAAIAPVKFGVSFITNPAEAINRSASGIHNMFDRAGAALSNQKAGRDNIANSLLGVSDAQRQLAIQLTVDPYSDFAPLQNRLQEMSRVMAGGTLTVKAGLAAVTGGVGMGISAAGSMEAVKDTLRDKTAAQVIAEVRGTLISSASPKRR